MAVKRVKNHEHMEGNKKSKVAREYSNLRKLKDHKNIIGLYGYFVLNSDTYICLEKMETCFAAILKLCIAKKTDVPTAVIKILCRTVAGVLCFMKEKNLMHRDIKLGIEYRNDGIF